ncbi:MAG TPA: hypothetical protein VHB01_08580 [Nitrosospira sp.]|nr:hypothetical protein [Nitrosospira sp.]
MASGKPVENESKVIILIPLKIVRNWKETSLEQERCSQPDRRIPGERLRDYCRNGCRRMKPGQRVTAGTAMADDKGTQPGNRICRPENAVEQALRAGERVCSAHPGKRNQERGGRCGWFRISEVKRTFDAAR